MKILILILLGLSYLLNSIVLQWLYPDVSSSHEAYYAFVAARNIVYECMFLMFFVLTYLLAEGKSMQSLACFFMILTGGSLIDKAIFKITEYLMSDILLIAIALAISIFIYVRKNP